MMSAKFSEFLTPPLCLHWDLIYTKIQATSLSTSAFPCPLPPPMRTSYLEGPGALEEEEEEK